MMHTSAILVFLDRSFQSHHLSAIQGVLPFIAPEVINLSRKWVYMHSGIWLPAVHRLLEIDGSIEVWYAIL